MSSGGFSKARLRRMHDVMAGYVERGEIPGIVTLVSRRGEVHVDAIGNRTAGSDTPIRRDTIFRISSMTKPITAVATMILVEECKLRLDEPVDRLLPELANRRVLKQIDGPLDDTVPANRPITVRDLLTSRMGLGIVMPTYPIQQAMDDLVLGQGRPGSNYPPAPEEWIRRLGTLPLIHQPGEAWMYGTGADVLGVLIARASGQKFETFLCERLFGPLGMKDTAFSVPETKFDRFVTSYLSDPESGVQTVYDDPESGQWSTPPAFPSGGGGLVSTVDDYHAFCQMLLNKGKHRNERILSRLSIEAMTTDQLTPEQRQDSEFILGANRSWGLGLSVVIQQDDISAVPGRFGWDGGLGTSAHTDPNEELIGILMTQLSWDSPHPPTVCSDFWTSAYQSIDD